jgi:hypothetical protein
MIGGISLATLGAVCANAGTARLPASSGNALAPFNNERLEIPMLHLLFVFSSLTAPKERGKRL